MLNANQTQAILGCLPLMDVALTQHALVDQLAAAKGTEADRLKERLALCDRAEASIATKLGVSRDQLTISGGPATPMFGVGPDTLLNGAISMTSTIQQERVRPNANHSN